MNRSIPIPAPQYDREPDPFPVPLCTWCGTSVNVVVDIVVEGRDWTGHRGVFAYFHHTCPRRIVL